MPTLTRSRKAPTPQSAQPHGRRQPAVRAAVRGGVQGVNLIILILVAASVTIAAGLLAKTVNTARSIDGKAKSISSTGGTINESTDAIAQLVLTNKIARSILKTATPLDGVLTKIDNTAKSINSDATSIDGLASSINSTAGTINTTAIVDRRLGDGSSRPSPTRSTAPPGQIDGVAGGINSVAGTINRTAEDDRHDGRPGAASSASANTIDNDATKIIANLTQDRRASPSRSRSTRGTSSSSPTGSSTPPAASTSKLPGTGKPPDSCQGKP